MLLIDVKNDVSGQPDGMLQKLGELKPGQLGAPDAETLLCRHGRGDDARPLCNGVGSAQRRRLQGHSLRSAGPRQPRPRSHALTSLMNIIDAAIKD